MNDNISLKALVVLMKASKSIEERVKRDIKRYGVSVTEFTILEALYHKGPLTVQQICDAVLINSGSMTYVIDKLQKRGMLKRFPSHQDRRVIQVQITDEGNKIMDEIFPQHQAVIEEIFADIELDDQKKLIAMLKTIGSKANNERE